MQFTVNFPDKYVQPFINAINKGQLESKNSREDHGIITTIYKWADCKWAMTVSQTRIVRIELISGIINDETLLIEYIKNGK